MTSSDHSPTDGFASLVPELTVLDLAASLGFWCDVLGFEIAYQRPEHGFAYLERGGAQVMLELSHGSWETGALEPPLGRGINIMIFVEDIDQLIAALVGAGWPLFRSPEDAWYRMGEQEIGQREFLVQDPDGYLLRFAQSLGRRPFGIRPHRHDTGDGAARGGRGTIGDNDQALELQLVVEELPAGFGALQADARAEGYLFVDRLATDWLSRTTRFDRAGEALLAARLDGVLAGIGGLTIEPVVPGALRMRRFYVRPSCRRSGIARKLATTLLERAGGASRLVTVNAAPASVPFWESLGFVPDARYGHTHILRLAERSSQ